MNALSQILKNFFLLSCSLAKAFIPFDLKFSPSSVNFFLTFFLSSLLLPGKVFPRDERRPPSFYFNSSSLNSKDAQNLPEKKESFREKEERRARASSSFNQRQFSPKMRSSSSLSPRNPLSLPSFHGTALLLNKMNKERSEKSERSEEKERNFSLESREKILILNTEEGFIPKKIRLFKNTFYQFYIVNANEKHQNASFVLSSFSKYHATYYGKVVSFELKAKSEGMFPFQSPETEAEGWLIVLPEKSHFFNFTSPALPSPSVHSLDSHSLSSTQTLPSSQSLPSSQMKDKISRSSFEKNQALKPSQKEKKNPSLYKSSSPQNQKKPIDTSSKKKPSLYKN